MKIVNDGTFRTHIYDDDGHDITKLLKVRRIEIQLNALEGPTCILHVIPDMIEITSIGEDSVTYVPIAPERKQ